MSLKLTLRDYLAHFYRISHIVGLTLDVDVLRRAMDEVIAASGVERGFRLGTTRTA